MKTAEALDIQALICSLFDELLEAHETVKQAHAAFQAHRQTEYPELKSAYPAIAEYHQDIAAQERWKDQHYQLQRDHERAQKWESLTIGRLAEHLPWNTWFKHGFFAIALATPDEYDDPAPFVAVEAWSDSLPNLHNDDQFLRYVNKSHD